MNALDRQRLRELIDATKREQIAEARRRNYTSRWCVECLVNVSRYTDGCRTCGIRRRKRGERARRARSKVAA